MRRRVGLVLRGVAAMLLLAGCSASAAADGGDGRDAGAAGTATRTTRASVAVREFTSVRRPEHVPPPTSIAIPAIGVSSDLQRLGRNPDGTIEVPDSWHRAGWYRQGPRPGQVGPAVILGHVDSREGPAIFYRADELGRGDQVVIGRADGSEVSFVVQRIERHNKARFPTHDVYLPTLQPTLRLVTCGGPFDTAAGHYRDNIVVFATQAT